MLASELGHVACVDFLLKAGVKKDAQNHIGGTALMLASSGSSEGHLGCIDLLLKAGADKDAQDSDGRTAVHASAEWHWVP